MIQLIIILIMIAIVPWLRLFFDTRIENVKAVTKEVINHLNPDKNPFALMVYSMMLVVVLIMVKITIDFVEFLEQLEQIKTRIKP